MTKRSERPVAASTAMNYRLLHFVMCDDVRLEAFTNKTMHIGVWNRLIVAAADPFAARQLRFVFAFRNMEPTKRAEAVTFELSGPSGFSLGPFAGDLAETPTGLVGISFGLDDVELPVGTYTVRVTLEPGAVFSEEFEVQADPALLDEIRRQSQPVGTASERGHRTSR